MNSFRVIFGQPYSDTGELFIGNKSALVCDIVPFSYTRVSLRKKAWIEAEHIGPTQLLLPCSRAMSQVALSPLTCLQRQQLPLILDNVTAVDGVHLQLHIPVRIPERQNKTRQHNGNNNNYDDLCVYHQQLQSRAIVMSFNFNWSQFWERLVWLSSLSRSWCERQWWNLIQIM